MKKLISCLLATLGIGTACSTAHDVEVNEFANLITQDDVEILDVRTPEEYAQGHIAGARNIDINHIDNFADSALTLLAQHTRVAVYCRSGRRSARAAQLLTERGRQVYNLKGGIEAWKQHDKPLLLPSADFDTLRTPGGKPVIVYPIMHASLRLRLGDVEAYVDPVSELGKRTVNYRKMPRASIVLVTHEHKDHLDEAAVNSLVSQLTVVYTNQRCDSLMQRTCQVMTNGDRASQYGVDIEAVPAYNTTPGHTQYHPKGRDNGFVLTYDGLRIYIAGDTEDIPEIAAIKDIDIAFLPCNQPYTMTVDQLVRAARVLRPKVVYPYHYSQTDISQLPALLKDDGIEVRLCGWE